MINELMKKYGQYLMRYDPSNKTLFIYTSMLVKDYVNLKNIIKRHKLEVNDIRLMGRR